VPGSMRYWIVLAAAAGLLAACNVHTAAQPPAGPPGPRLKVGLLQGNIPQDEKFEGGSGIPLALDWYARRLRDTDAQLVVAPETAIPLLPAQLPDGYLEALRDSFAHGPRAALVGIPLGSFEEGYTNSVMGFEPGGAPYRYHKHHLVPFGEFIPPLFKWFTRMMNIPLGDFNRGDVGQPSFVWQGQRLAPNICYEDLFGEELGARFADPANAPTIFVNLSNIAWFGDTVAIDQHLQISRMRALEFERPMIRATNTGATAIIDRFGRVTQALPRHTRGVLVGEVEGGTRLTPYARWVARAGLAPLWVLAFAAALTAWWAGRRPPRP
jgi:apolipoprotein N-acyltransferase